MSKVLIMVATTGSNQELGNKIAEIMQEQGGEFDIVNLEELNMPLYTPVNQKEGHPDCVKNLTEQVKSASGFVIIGPEYNGSIPPVISNAIAWISTSGDKDWRAGINGKFTLLATNSGGPGLKYQGAMTQQMNHLGAIVLPRMISTHGGKPFNPDSATTIIKQFLGHL